MTAIINIHAAKTHLSRLVDRAAAGEEIVIARAGKPVARLAPLAARRRRSAGNGDKPVTSDAEDFWARAAALRRRLRGRPFKDSAAAVREGRERQARKLG